MYSAWIESKVNTNKLETYTLCVRMYSAWTVYQELSVPVTNRAKSPTAKPGTSAMHWWHNAFVETSLRCIVSVAFVLEEIINSHSQIVIHIHVPVPQGWLTVSRGYWNATRRCRMRLQRTWYAWHVPWETTHSWQRTSSSGTTRWVRTDGGDKDLVPLTPSQWQD